MSSRSVIKVYPGPNDTQALIDAFAKAKAEGKDAIVKLMPGTFKIGMIEVREFKGALSGSGKGKTILTNLPDLTPDAVIAANKLPALITFIGGEVSVSDLSIALSEGLTWLGNNDMNMLLFSDYSADFTPATKQIRVNLNNIEVAGVLQKDVTMPDGAVTDYPYYLLNGAKFAPDIQLNGNTIIPRCNIDVTITNSKFSKFWRGVYVWGCKSGNLKFGIEGRNTFTENQQSLVVNENIGVNVKIMNNEFTIPDYCFNGLDINTGEAFFGDLPLENVREDLGNYDIRYNTFNINYSNGMGVMDAWRYAYPENPSRMKMIWDHNTFNALKDGAWFGLTFALKDVVFSNNKIAGDFLDNEFNNFGIYWITDTNDPNYWLSWSENCKFVNNIILQNNFSILLDWDTKNWLIQGDLSNITVTDNGVNNKVISLKHHGHQLSKDSKESVERVHDMYKRQHDNIRH
ncbi:MAG: hypothetical protein WCS03_07720 [Bacteroidota bacterium]